MVAEPLLPGAAEKRSGGRWWRVFLLVVGILAVLALVAAGVVTHLGVRSDLRESERALALTGSRLDEATNDLDETLDTLRETESSLDRTTEERNQLRDKLSALRVDLEGVKGSLEEAQDTVLLQTGQIATLTTCLNGVSEALDNVIYGFYNAAINALIRVEDACNQAYALF
jgi:septal ring factor EnvC (AmiA/AmiB activator)